MFNLKLSEFTAKSKELSKKQLSEEDVNSLLELSWGIIEDLKSTAIDKLKSKEVVIKYSNNKEFPPLDNVTESDKKIIQFTVACSLLHKYLTKDIVKLIVQKSPLEMVSIIKELNIFFKFITADPSDFGHGVLTEKQGDTTAILATNDAILRICKVIVYTDLLNDDAQIYKLSRITTYLCNNYENVTLESLRDQISTLKRSTIDNSRIGLYIPKVTK